MTFRVTSQSQNSSIGDLASFERLSGLIRLSALLPSHYLFTSLPDAQLKLLLIRKYDIDLLSSTFLS